MSQPSPLESRLFRLCLGLKVAFWAALGAILVKAIWASATGREPGEPMTLVWVVAALAFLQLCALFAWWRVRRARQRRGA